MLSRRFPLHKRVESGGLSYPAITLLKPLKGIEPDTKRCLSTWLNQSYTSPIQILFGVACPNDPVCGLVRDLLVEFPKADARLIICDKSLAPNPKVSSLIQLEPHIQHKFVIVSDADVSIPPEFLQNITSLLAEPSVGLVHCFYRLANPSTLAMQWEGLAVNADFWSEVLQARSLKEIDFALGAVMALPVCQLNKVGGFASLAHFLADDYQLGQKVAQSGGRIVFSSIVVDCWESSLSWKQVWGHQLRWARTIRACQPFPFFLSILNNATLWPVLWLAAQFTSAWAICLGCLAFRIATAFDMQTRFTRMHANSVYWWFVPVKDLLNVAVWALSFLGSNIEWRGERHRIVKGGKLVKIEDTGNVA